MDECLCACIQHENAAREQLQFPGLEGRYDETVRHVDAELVARQSTAGMAIQASYQSILLVSGPALAFDLSPRLATIDEFVFPPDRIDASRNRGDVWVRPLCEGKSLGKLIAAYTNNSACLVSPHERHLAVRQRRPSDAG